jgi:hypothetical protein
MRISRKDGQEDFMKQTIFSFGEFIQFGSTQ